MADQHVSHDPEPDVFGAASAKASRGQLSVGELFAAAAALASQEGLGRAAQLYKIWIAYNAADPLLYAVYFNYGVCLRDLADLPGAVTAFRDSIKANATFYPPYINLGRALEDSGQPSFAVAQWVDLVNGLATVNGETVTLKATALQQIGRVLEDQLQDAAAEDALKQGFSLNVAQVETAQHWIALRQRQCEWPVVQPWDHATRKDLLKGISPLSLTNLADDPLFQLAAADRYCRHAVGLPPSLPRRPHVARRDPRQGGPLKVGYVSSDLREHAVGFAMTDVLETHDRDVVEVFAYYCGIARDDTTKTRSQAAADHWIDIGPLDDVAAARRIAEDGIDILVDLNGYTKSARTKVFALRPAPIAVNWFGFPGTMGSPYHHYLVADPYVVPPGNEIYYSETVLRLPCYQPNDRKRPVSPNQPTRRDVGLPDDGVVFCCLNGMQKLTEATFGRWMSVLGRVPDSVLWLLTGTADTNERLRARAAALGVAPDRLVFAEKRLNPDHLARYPLADLFLDTLPYGAHTTAADAVWMGVPILTLSGRSFASRVCGSVLTAAGLADLICASPEDYVERAVALGRDRAALNALKARAAANRDTCLLFDTPQLVRRLEDLYRVMWGDFEAGRRPVPQLANLDVYHAVGLDLEIESAERLDDAAYLARYRDGLTQWNEVYRLPADGRLWPAANRS